jgi:hypothetical protein
MEEQRSFSKQARSGPLKVTRKEGIRDDPSVPVNGARQARLRRELLGLYRRQAGAIISKELVVYVIIPMA